MQDLMKKIGFTEEEQTFFCNLRADVPDAAHKRIEYLMDRYMGLVNDEKFAAGSTVSSRTGEILTYLAEGMGVNPFSMKLLFVLECGLKLPGLYEEAGYDVALAYDLLCDLKYKLDECRKLHGVMGTHTWPWYLGHFRLERFALGRFQYNPAEWKWDEPYTFGDYTLKQGDPIYRMHIPSSGPMPREARMDSYRRAHAFLKHEGDILPIICETWLLYEANRGIFAEGSNLYDFMDDFDIFQSYEKDAQFPDAWRVFYKEYNGDTSILPRDTSLQREYIKWLDAGKKIGCGIGVILFDGERIINNRRDNV